MKLYRACCRIQEGRRKPKDVYKAIILAGSKEEAFKKYAARFGFMDRNDIVIKEHDDDIYTY